MSALALGLAALDDHDWRTALNIALDAGFRDFDVQIDSTSRFTRSIDEDGDGVAGFAEFLTAESARAVCVSNVRDVELLLGPHDRHTDAVLPGERNAKIDHALTAGARTIDTAAALGIKCVRLYFGCPDHLLMFPWHRFDASWDENVTSMVEASVPLFERAAAREVLICIEPHPRQALFRLDSVLPAKAMLQARGFDLGLCYDPANIAAGGLDPVDYLHTYGRAPEVVHLKDVQLWSRSPTPSGSGWRRYGPGLMSRFRVPGAGELDWQSISDVLTSLDFRGPLVIELEDPLVPPADAMPAARAFAERFQSWGSSPTRR